MSAPSTDLPTRTELPTALNYLTNPISTYFDAYPPYNNVVLAALIFTPPPQPPRILLLQNAGGGTDPYAFSHYWQIPSGKPINADPTLCHALSRVVREQTGLELTHVSTMVGTEEGRGSRQTGKAVWMKMNFVVEVAELAPGLRSPASKPSETTAFGFEFGHEAGDPSTNGNLNLGSVQVELDPQQHNLYMWATESELKGFIHSGLYPTEERAQYQILLEAFALYRQDFSLLENLRRIRQNAASEEGFWP